RVQILASKATAALTAPMDQLEKLVKTDTYERFLGPASTFKIIAKMYCFMRGEQEFSPAQRKS
ncbi:MAG: hypothetical protein AAF755_07130, partial [Pseudomonadota bacterium]